MWWCMAFDNDWIEVKFDFSSWFFLLGIAYKLVRSKGIVRRTEDLDVGLKDETCMLNFAFVWNGHQQYKQYIIDGDLTWLWLLLVVIRIFGAKMTNSDANANFSCSGSGMVKTRVPGKQCGVLCSEGIPGAFTSFRWMCSTLNVSHVFPLDVVKLQRWERYRKREFIL